jgi:hypothetical protein
MTGSRDRGAYDYGRARVAGGLILIGLAAVLMVIDALSVDYSVDSIQLGLILGTGSVLLGVEAIRKYVSG